MATQVDNILIIANILSVKFNFLVKSSKLFKQKQNILVPNFMNHKIQRTELLSYLESLIISFFFIIHT